MTRPRRVTVQGEGRIWIRPTVAEVEIGASIVRPNLHDALEHVAATTTRVIESLRSHGLGDDDLRTSEFGVEQVFDYEVSPPRATGFQVVNLVVASVHDVPHLSEILDDALAAGATRVGGIRFRAHEPREIEARAREAAFADARTRARQLAEAAGARLGDALRISEGVVPPPVEFAARDMHLEGATGGTPVESGATEIVVRIAVTFALE